MAWDAYISQNLMAPLNAEGHTLTSAAILGLEGGVWAQSAEFPALGADEVSQLMEAFDSPAITSVSLGGVKYMKLSADGTVMRGRKDKTGFVARKTTQAAVIGIYTEPTVDARTCNKVVEALGDYLADQGY